MTDIRIRASSACPGCGTRHVVDLTRRLEPVPPGRYALAGMQTKAAAREVWRWECSCGAAGEAQPPDVPCDPGALSVGTCGHHKAARHVPGRHAAGETDLCPGCCPTCQREADNRRAARRPLGGGSQ